MFGQLVQPLSSWDQISEALGEEYEVRTVDLTTGVVDGDINVLVVIGPQNLDEKALYAIDQHLMRGGALIVAAGNMGITYDQYSGGLGSAPVVGGLREMLQHYGFTVEDTLVMDAQNEPSPSPSCVR